MTRQQRFRYEMFVRVRDFGVTHAALFPEGSKGGQTFTRVVAAVTAIEEHQKDHLLVQAEAHRVKAATRDAVFEYMKTLAATARRVTRQEPAESPFVLPRKRRLGAELASARVFMEAAATRQKEFEQFGLPPTFITDFKAKVEQLQQAADVRLSGRTERRKAQAGISEAMAEGMDAARDLDVIVAIATRQTDPATFAAWTAARRIEGQTSGGAKVSAAPRVSEPATPPAPSEPRVASVPNVPAAGELEKAS